jgi:hypothetical protein
MINLGSYAKRFLLRPITKEDSPEQHNQIYGMLRATKDENMQWHVDMNHQVCSKKGKEHIQAFTAIPSIFPGHTEPCLNNVGDYDNWGTCVRDSSLPPSNSRIWCNKCDVATYCSLACKRENKELHKGMCEKFNRWRAFMKFGRTCSNCGLAEDPERPFQKCGRCRDPSYCKLVSVFHS